jgi:hypothetical protein
MTWQLHTAVSSRYESIFAHAVFIPLLLFPYGVRERTRKIMDRSTSVNQVIDKMYLVQRWVLVQ